MTEELRICFIWIFAKHNTPHLIDGCRMESQAVNSDIMLFYSWRAVWGRGGYGCVCVCGGGGTYLPFCRPKDVLAGRHVIQSLTHCPH